MGQYRTYVAGPTQNNSKNMCRNFRESFFFNFFTLKIKEYRGIFAEMTSAERYF
jgi:hypothetical protein